VLAIYTLRTVNTEHLPAFWASPPFFFVSDEMPNSESSYLFEIFNHAHVVLGPVPLIQMFQIGAWEAVADEAELGFSACHLLAVLDPTNDAGFRFEAIIATAAGAWVPISCVRTAAAAVHSAWSDQLY